MKKIKEKNRVTKLNVLNEMRSSNLNFQEVRFLCIYLSMINRDDPSTRQVSFSLENFKKIMDLSYNNLGHLKSVMGDLLSKTIFVPTKEGGLIGFQLFKECRLYKKDNEWHIGIDAHDSALPLFFEYQNRFFTYQLWNALRLRSSNQIRMYELLKQYQKIGHRVISINDLRDYLGISKDEYLRYERFKKSVLNVCQQALEEHTDIKFTYEPYGKKGPGGKIFQLKFKIYENKDYEDPLTLEHFIDMKSVVTMPDLNHIEAGGEELEELLEQGLIGQGDYNIALIRHWGLERFTIEEIRVLYNLVVHSNVIPSCIDGDRTVAIHKQIKYWYDNAKRVEANGDIEKSFYGYVKSTVTRPILI